MKSNRKQSAGSGNEANWWEKSLNELLRTFSKSAGDAKAYRQRLGDLVPLVIVTVVLAFATLLFCVLGWNAWSSYQDQKRIQEYAFPVEKLKGMIIHFDEVLTMSAAMAAATGDPEWENRYREYEPQLRAALEGIIELLPGYLTAESAVRTARANNRLVEIENRVFDLVRQDRRKEATALLFGEEYRRQKEVYIKGMEQISSDLCRNIKCELDEGRRHTFFSITSTLVMLPILIVTWIWALRVMRNHIVRRRQAEEDLKKSGLYLDSMVDTLIVLDSQQNIIKVNEAFSQLWGYSAKEVLGKSVFEVFPETEASKHREYMEKAMESHAAVTFETTALTKKGQEIPLWIHGNAVFDVNNELAGFIEIFRDMSERLKGEQALRLSEQRFKAVAETAHDAIVSANSIGEIIFWNPAAEKMFGYSADEIVGKNLTTIMPARYRKVHRNAINAAVTSGRLRFAGGSREFCGLRKDGTEFPLELTVSRWAIAEGIFFTAMIGDITDRKRAEDELRASEQKYRDLVETMNEGLGVADENYMLTYVNRKFADMLGYSREEMVGHHLTDFLDEDSAKVMSDQMARRRRGEAELYDVMWAAKDGARVYTIVSPKGIFDSGGNFMGSIATLTDITERKKTEDILRSIVEGSSGATGEEFFRILVKSLAGALGFRYAFVGELIDPELERVRTIAVWANGRYTTNFEYDLAGTPCENIVGQKTRCYAEKVQELFPEDGLLVELEVESYLGTPLFDSSGRALGLLVVMDDKKMEQVALAESMLTIFAARAASELDRRRVEEDLIKYRRHLEELVEARTSQLTQEIDRRIRLEQQILSVSEEERRTIGRELHDSIGQQLTGIAFMTKVLEQKLTAKSLPEAEEVEKMSVLVNQTTDQARALAKGLHPMDLSLASLMSSLPELAAGTEKLYGVNCTFKCDQPVETATPEVAVHLYRIAQEAVTNAVKHGQAENIHIDLIHHETEGVLSVRNDGVDFPEDIDVRGKGIGLQIMDHRVDIIGACLDIRKAPEGGTILTCIFPIKGDETAEA